MLSSKIQQLGDLRLNIYDFEFSGDVLEKHVHNENNIHITIVARGKVKASSHDWEIEVSAGGIIDFRPNEPHEIEALEDNTRIVNIPKKMEMLLKENRIT
jgi:quercetin dioxygenase-like cupin family protein